MENSLSFFVSLTRRDRIRGTICFFLGIVMVIGMCIEGFGFLNLFGNFLPTVLAVARQIPGLSTVLDLPVVAQAADFIAGKTRPKYSV
jgi:Got1/Sft2-like family